MASSARSTLTHDRDASSVRPRNRRLASVESGNDIVSREPSTIRGTARLASGTSTPLRDASPLPTHRLDVAPPDGGRRGQDRRTKNPVGAGTLGLGLINGSWATTWGNVQDLAAGWISGNKASAGNGWRGPPSSNQTAAEAMGGEARMFRPWARETASPSPRPRPTIQDVGAGIIAEREAALIAARTASVLESHDGVNGGLDVAGRYKLRTSDELPRQTSASEQPEETLVYIHHVKPTDTHVGVILKYGCRDEAFKKLNGLWSRDSISTRKWVAIPVDACEIKGKPCAGPSAPLQKVDLLAPTPEIEIDDYGWRGTGSTTQQRADDVFGPSSGLAPPVEAEGIEDSEQLWTHVRWVSLDSLAEPVEMARISRKALGYFPPRRKKSVLTTSSAISTPRESLEVQSSVLGSTRSQDRREPLSRRHSTLSSRPTIPSSVAGTSTPRSTRSRMGSLGADTRPVWMRHPGGVGSLNQSVRTPGPAKDPLNSWAKKHFPSLVIDPASSLPLPAETTDFHGNASTLGDGDDASTDEQGTLPSARQGTGIDRAAATVETWLRGAFMKRPGTPTDQARWGENASDLIELTDTQN